MRGRPRGFMVHVRDIEIAAGAGFLVVLNSFPAPPALAMRPRRSCLGDSGS
ncbi:MAG: hypothetical protein ACXWO1_11620 [Isosphaeraceae bacterium]